jgi:hypothetical protein
MLNLLIIIVTLAVASCLTFLPQFSRSSFWQATVTPLASIMGSGFLVSAPLLAGVVGNLAVFYMIILLVFAYLIGGVIRFNIRYFEPIEANNHNLTTQTAFLSRLVLAGAYFVSVSYYLQLLAAFLLNSVGIDNQILAHTITSLLLATICGVGMWQGLEKLGALEKYVIGLNLGAIAALIFALAVYNGQLVVQSNWALPSMSSGIQNFKDLRIILGLLIVVQGFETSRYLGSEFSSQQRVVTMRAAQIIASVVYVVFLALVTVLFHSGLGKDVTAIISMTHPVATILPIILSIAAIGSQFSAAVADTEGAGGLIEESTNYNLPNRYAYLLILAITLTLTWETNVNSIIAYASRAFALYYALQCGVAFMVAWQQQDLKRRSLHLATYVVLGLFCLAVFILGLPAE